MPEPCHATVAFGPFDTDTRKAGKSRGHRSGTAGALRDIPPSDAPAGDQTILIFPISYENDLVGPAPEPRPSTVASRYSDSAYSEPGKSPSGSHPGTADAFCGFPSPRVSRAIFWRVRMSHLSDGEGPRTDFRPRFGSEAHRPRRCLHPTHSRPPRLYW